MTVFHAAVSGTLVVLALLMTLGFSLQRRWWAGVGRWPHHALYLLTCLGTLACAALAGGAGRAWWPFVTLLALLLGMSRTRPGRPGHWRLAVLVAAAWAGVACRVW